VVLEQASAEGESSPYFLNKLGELRFEQGRDDEAIAAFRRAIPPADDFPCLTSPRGDLREARRRRAAAEHYERAITLEPGILFKAQFTSPDLTAASGDAERARQLWRRASCRTRRSSRAILPGQAADGHRPAICSARAARPRGIRLDPEHDEGPLGYYVLADHASNRAGRSNEARAAMARGREIQAGMK